MKFSTILTPAFFALFIFSATIGVATPTNNTSGETSQTADKEDVDNIFIISSRSLQVTDRDAATHRSIEGSYTMHVRVMKNASLLAEGTTNNETITLDLSDLDAGIYLCIVETSTGTERKFIRIE